MQQLTFFDGVVNDAPQCRPCDGKVDKSDYDAFVEKFKTKKTTDDCYTPPNVYEAVAEWVANEYKVDRGDFVRPFYPGGDYERYDYPQGCVVVDNPPFSILSAIVRFYLARRIGFFLFAPTLTLFSHTCVDYCCAIGVGAQVVYENGAEVNTSFLTNLDAPGIRTAPSLYSAVDAENTKNLRTMKKQLPKYQYPAHVITGARLAYLCKYGLDFRANAGEIFRVSELDAQKALGKRIFGYGFLLSDMKAAEKAKAEANAEAKAEAKVWALSEREQRIIKKLNKGGGVVNG